MRKTTSLIAILMATYIWVAPNALSQSIVDPGISTHNYKHANKAAKAKAAETNTVEVATFKTIERYSKSQKRGTVSSTPKYAPQPKALVVFRSYEPEGIKLNPLESERHYKTTIPPIRATKYETADSTTPQNITFPNVD